MAFHRRTIILALGGVLATSAFAHADSNHVYIGQTGETNIVTVTQTGLSNQVGANAQTLLLNQDGRDNVVTVTQFGWANAVATVPHAIPDLAPYKVPARGINQTGNDNRLTLDQADAAPAGFNAIEAIYQGASGGFEGLSNDLVVMQSPMGGSGEAGHRIGEIVELNPDPGAAPNVMMITQTGGGAGIGNLIQSVRHEGHGNGLTIRQSVGRNEIDTVRQIGDANVGNLVQEIGGGNLIAEAKQRGDRNRLDVRQSGTDNYLGRILQNNDGMAISGHMARLATAGDDNGGDGRGGLGRFATIAASVGVAQATVTQTGGDRDSISYTIGIATGEGTTAGSSHNLFGFYQEGNGNGVTGTTTGSNNEVAVLQKGDGNALDLAQGGIANAVAVTLKGDGNNADITQRGTANTVKLEWAGSTGSDHNNAPGLSFSGLSPDSAPLLGVASAHGLVPGDIRQSGAYNGLDLTITNGDRNRAAFLQTGSRNSIAGSVTGTANQVLAIQAGTGNIAGFSQAGRNNHLIIQQ